MLDKLFPTWAAHRSYSKYLATVYEKAGNLIEGTPEFARDEDEGDWTMLYEGRESYSEEDLNTLRGQARKMCDINPAAFGLIEAMVGFILGKNATISAEDPDIQDYWDGWVRATKFDMRSKELVRRLLRDGEFFLRFFKGAKEMKYKTGKEKVEEKTAKYPVIRFIDPEEIKDSTNTHSYGIETLPDDVETAVNFIRCFMKEGTEATETIPAEEVIQGKIRCDSNEKRGKSFLLGLAKYITQYATWLDDRVRLNRIRSIFHFVMTPKGNFTPAQLKAKFQDEDTTATSLTPSKKMPKPGSFIIGKGADYKFESLDLNAADTATDGRNIERMICKGTGLMEGVVTGDFSNQNYASSLVAESPMVKAIENWQDIVGDLIQQIFTKVVRFGKANNAIGKSASEECAVNFATLVHRELDRDTNAYQVHKQNSWASDKTISTKLGYDYDAEQEQIEQELKTAVVRDKKAQGENPDEDEDKDEQT